MYTLRVLPISDLYTRSSFGGGLYSVPSMRPPKMHVIAVLNKAADPAALFDCFSFVLAKAKLIAVDIPKLGEYAETKLLRLVDIDTFFFHFGVRGLNVVRLEHDSKFLIGEIFHH